MSNEKTTWKNLDWTKATIEDIQTIIENGGDINQEILFETNKATEDDLYSIDNRQAFRAPLTTYLYEWRSPLALATLAKNKYAVAYLLEKGANPNYVACNRMREYAREYDPIWRHCPLLTLAIRTKNSDIINLYFMHSVDPFNFEGLDKPRIHRDGAMDPGDRIKYTAELIETNHPIIEAIRCEDKKTLEKLFTYDIPEFQQMLLKQKCPEDRRGLWLNFYALFYNQTESDRRNTRKVMAQSFTEGKTEEVRKLANRLAGRNFSDPLRDSDAKEYHHIRKRFGSKAASFAYKEMQAKRTKALVK